MSLNCKFCEIGQKLASARPWDEVIAESPNYVVIPSVGGFVDGWVLIVPKRHCLSMAVNFADQELADLRQRTSRALKTEYHQSVWCFEHGAAFTGSQTGCGVDHAHLHLVPLACSLSHVLLQNDAAKNWRQIRASDLGQFAAGREYLFYSSNSSDFELDGYVGVAEKPVSQYFRRAIAEAVGRPAFYDYRDYPELERAAETGRRLRGLSSFALTAA